MLKLFLWLQYFLCTFYAFFRPHIFFSHWILKFTRLDHITKHIDYRCISPRIIQMYRAVMRYLTIKSIIIVWRIVSNVWFIELLLRFIDVTCWRGIMVYFVLKRDRCWRIWRNRYIIRIAYSLRSFLKIIVRIIRFLLTLWFIRIFLYFCKIAAFSWLVRTWSFS